MVFVAPDDVLPVLGSRMAGMAPEDVLGFATPALSVTSARAVDVLLMYALPARITHDGKLIGTLLPLPEWSFLKVLNVYELTT